MVNNAGNGITGPLYAMPLMPQKNKFEVNFFGVVRVSSAILPGMIEKGTGLVINIGSLAGLFGCHTRACTVHLNLQLKATPKACVWNTKYRR